MMAREAPAGATVVDARVSSAGQRPSVRIWTGGSPGWVSGRHLAVDRVVTEVRSALNGPHQESLALLRDPKVSTIVVEHRDRFAEFDAEYVESALAASGRRLLVGDPAELDDDLAWDVILVAYSRRAGWGARSGLC